MSLPDVLAPQPGGQTRALRSPADITFYGGAAGSGKTVVDFLSATRGVEIPGYSAVMFRKEDSEIWAPGGFWDLCQKYYPGMGAKGRQDRGTWYFPSGAIVRCTHLSNATGAHPTHLKHKGAEYACIVFDEVTEFTEEQFWYLWSRNRTTCGVRPWMLATCNPEPGWVYGLLKWWIRDDGYPDPDRDGVLRWFVREGESDELRWVEPDYPNAISLTFIRGTLKDNPALTEADPGYKKRQMSQKHVTRMRLLGDEDLGGNWKIREGHNKFSGFDPVFVPLSMVPKHILGRRIRTWDFGSRVPDPKDKRPSLTAGALTWLGRHRDVVALARMLGVEVVDNDEEFFIIFDLLGFHATPGEKETRVVEVAEKSDGMGVPVYIEKERGSTGEDVKHLWQTRNLPDFDVRFEWVEAPKDDRSDGWCAMGERRRVLVVEGPHVRVLRDVLENYPSRDVLDYVDCLSLGHLKGRTHQWPQPGALIPQKPSRGRELRKYY